MTLQPSVQQSGRHESHEQYLCDRKYPTDANNLRDQFGRMQVHFVGLNISTPYGGSLRDSLACLEGSFKFWCPFESAPLAEKWFEWCYNVAQLCIVRNLTTRPNQLRMPMLASESRGCMRPCILARVRWFRQICGTLRSQQFSARNGISMR